MRVIHVLRKCDPSAWGGTEMALQRIFKGLREQGVLPIIYRPRLAHENGDDPLAASGFLVKRFNAFVPIVGLPRERKQQLVSVGGNLMSFDLVTSLWREKDVGVVHAHTLGRIGGIALTMAKRHKAPFVVTIHGGVLDLPQELKATFNAAESRGWDWGRLFGLLFQSRRLFVDAQAIITCNENEASLLRETLPGKRIVVQPHGVDLALYRTDHRPAALEAFPELRGRRTLLCLGRLDPVKNQGWLLKQAPDLLGRYPNTMLVFTGACTDELYGAEIRRRIQELGLEGQVLLTGGLPPEDPRLMGLLQQAELLILPSLSETFGLVILEAWAAGTPVLASKTSGAMALIEHGVNGLLFDLQDPTTFHQAIAALFEDRDLALTTARRGSEKAAAEFSISRVASMLKQLYEQVIEERNHPRKYVSRKRAAVGGARVAGSG